MSKEPRFTYAGPYLTETKARMKLDDMMNAGEVSEGERPKVEPRQCTLNGRPITAYVITLPFHG